MLKFNRIKLISTIAIFTITPLFTMESVFATSTTTIKGPYPIPSFQKVNIPNYKCPKAPKPEAKPSENLKFNSIYTDRSEGVSIIDYQARDQYKKQIKPIEDYEKQISSWTDKIIQGNTSNINYCTIDWLYNWAENDALLTNNTNFQGQAVRKWFLATIASHYYLLNQHIKIPTDKKTTIDNWIKQLTETVIYNYSEHTNRNSRHNNHIYWSAWAVVIASIVLNNTNYFNWGLEQAKNGIQEIQKNGVLPRELKRERRAFTYHVFAAAPLIMIAETAKQNNIDIYNQNGGALHKLVSLIITELNHKQSALTALTGKRQDTMNTITPYSLAWIEVYNARFPSSKTQKWINRLKPMKSRRLGGNMSLLFDRKITEKDKPQ